MLLLVIFIFSGAKKRLRLLRLENLDKTKKKRYDPNVVGLESTDDDESTSSEDDLEVIANGVTVNEDTAIIEVEEKDKNSENVLENNLKEKDTSTSSIDLKTNEEVKLKEEPKKEVKKPLLDHPTVHVDVKRDPKVQVARLKLPILAEEQRIMELVNENEFLIVAGETG